MHDPVGVRRRVAADADGAVGQSHDEVQQHTADHDHPMHHRLHVKQKEGMKVWHKRESFTHAVILKTSKESKNNNILKKLCKFLEQSNINAPTFVIKCLMTCHPVKVTSEEISRLDMIIVKH